MVNARKTTLYVYVFNTYTEEELQSLRVGPEELPYGHHRVDDYSKADVGFLWLHTLPDGKPLLLPRVAFQLGKFDAEGKPICVGMSPNNRKECSNDYAIKNEIAHHGLNIQNVTTQESIRSAYDVVMADLDICLPRKPKLQYAKRAGKCLLCNTPYRRHHMVRVQRGLGVYHQDCYSREFDPEKRSVGLFNAELIDALREETVLLTRQIEQMKQLKHA